MRAGFTFIFILISLYGCKEGNNQYPKNENETKSTVCEFFLENGYIDNGWHYYFIDSEEYPFFYAIVNGEITDRKNWKDFLKCKEKITPLCEFILDFFNTGGFFLSHFINEGFSLIMDFTEPLTRYETEHFKIYKAREKTEEGLFLLTSSHSQACKNSIGEILYGYPPAVGETKCFSCEGCVFDIHYNFKGVEECVEEGMEPLQGPIVIYPPEIYTKEDGWIKKCPENIIYKGISYMDGLTAPRETEFRTWKGVSWFIKGIVGNNYTLNLVDIFLWESALNENLIFGVVSAGIEEIDRDYSCPLTSFTLNHLYLMGIYLKMKGEILDEIINKFNSILPNFNCKKGERIDRCIYSQLKMEEVYSCLERGKKRINEDGALFPFFSASDYWCDNHKDCPYEFFERSFFYPPISCAPGYPFSSE